MNSAMEWTSLQRVAILLALAAFALYLPTLFHSFFADDDIYLAFKNSLLRDTGWLEVHRLLLERANPWEYLPLRDLSYWLDLKIYGNEGVGLHFTNLVWYALSAGSAGLLFRELILLFKPAWSQRAAALAWAGVALFIIHPAHVEAVAWVASRKDLMSGTFALLSAFVLARSIRCQYHAGGIALTTVLLLMSCFSKGGGMTIAIFECAVLMMAWRLFPEISRFRKLAPFILLCGAAGFAAVVHMKTGAETGIRIAHMLGFPDVLERASRILTALLHLLLAPDSMGLYHDVYAQGPWHWIVSGVTAVFLLAALGALTRQKALWPLGMILLLAPCAVYLQFIPFATWSLASERFVFVSVAGLALILMDILGRIPPGRGIILLLAIFLPCAVITWERVDDWEYPSTLREHEYERLPNFHNAIRDHVLYTLLPKQQYGEAEYLARKIRNPDISNALLALIDTDRNYRLLGNWRAADKAVELATFCRSLHALRDTLQTSRAALRYEPDYSYGNLLSSLNKEIEVRYETLEKRCALLPH